MVAIKIYQTQLYLHYLDPRIMYMLDVFKDFLDLVVCKHDNVYLKWKVNPFDLNNLGIE